jgi:hypothetical protein
VDFAGAGGILRGQRFHRWLTDHLPATFEELEFPLVCTATDIDTGELVRLDRGDLVSAVPTRLPRRLHPVEWMAAPVRRPEAPSSRLPAVHATDYVVATSSRR